MGKRFLAALAVIVAVVAGPVSAHGQQRGAILLQTDDQAGPVRLYERSYALVIGIDAYSGSWPRLSNAVADARAVASELEARGFDVTLEENLDAEALENVVEDFIYYRGGDPDSRLLIWFAGHGHTINNEAYLVPADAPSPVEDREFRRRALSLRDFGKFMREVESKHVLAIFDACFSGTVFDTARTVPPAAITRATGLQVRQMISSGDAGQTVSDDGTFRTLFLDALRGLEPLADANRDGYLTGSELGLFLSDKITNLTESQQTPRYGKLRALGLDRGDFVFEIAGISGREVAAAEPNGAAAPRGPPLETIGGTWATSFGEMQIPAVSGGQVIALYADDGGRIVGELAGTTLTGFWIEAKSDNECAELRDGSHAWGRVEFAFAADLKSFSGRWGYCDGALSRDWTGRRAALTQPESEKTIERQADEQATIGGAWVTNFGDLQLPAVSGGEVNARYSQDDGRIFADLAGATLTGTWVESKSDSECAETRDGSHAWGRFEFIFSADRTTFSGRWSHCDGPLSRTWTGTRAASPEP